MNKLEAQIVVENTGNYDEEETEDILEVYETVMKHVGFKDNRRDSRFVVKFHDIFYYAPKEIEDTDAFNGLFEAFCYDMYDVITERAHEKNIDIDEMLHPMYVGHYQAFVVDIEEITNDNAIDVAMKVYDEFNYNGKKYVENYIYLVDLLQDLEDNYMTYWIEFLRSGEYMPEEQIKEIEDNYKKDIERRKK
jgi:hypothetical protein